MTAHGRGAKAPESVERFLKALVVTHKAVGLYPITSELPRQSAVSVLEALHEFFQERAELTLAVRKDGMLFEDLPVLASRASATGLAVELYNRRVSEIRFHAGASVDDVLGFLSVLSLSPAQTDASGGYSANLWERGVTGVTVTEVKLTVLDADELLHPTSQSGNLSKGDIDHALDPRQQHTARDQVVLARFFGDPQAISQYLTTVHQETDSVETVAHLFLGMAGHAAELVEGGIAAPRNLADALGHIDEALRSEMLLGEVLPEARENEAVADILRQVDIDTLFRMLVAGIDPDAPPIEDLAHGIRQAMSLYANNPEDMVISATAAMRDVGMSESDIGQVLVRARPKVISLDDREPEPVAQAVGAEEALTQAAQHPYTPLSDEEIAQLPEMDQLREEAERGVTESDVALALIDLVAYDVDHDYFDAVMDTLEAYVRMMAGHTQMASVVEAAEALSLALGDPRFSAEQRERIEKALLVLARPADIRAIVVSLRSANISARQRESAQRLLDLLGARAVDPLFEELAGEQDMAARKSLVDVLSRIAPRHIQEVGRYVNDDRWYVVRNAVSILGATRSSAAIPYLERTMRHSDERVRRETIRALSSISDRFASQMLQSALTDEDAQNVQLAARYLGSAGVEAAVPALERVARGEGYGNREISTRVEAIEALGRMGAKAALPTLESLASRRWLAGAKTKELRTAATAAVDRIKSGRGGAR